MSRFAIRSILLLGCVTAASIPSAAAQQRAFTPVTGDVLAAPPPGDWVNWRRTLDSQGHSPLDQVNTRNVGGLKLAWSWGIEPGVNQPTPLVRDGILYVTGPGGIVHALDGATGDLIWEYRREVADERMRAAQQMRHLAIYEDLILLNTDDAYTVALDARTGKVRWDTPTAPEGVKRRFTSGPLVAEGVVISGMTGCAADAESCYIVGVDGRTGQLLWRTSTVALPGEEGDDTWGGVPLEKRAGGDAWIPGSYDPSTGLVYIGTAQAKPWSRDARGTGGGTELYTNSTLALDPKSGEIRWYYQHIPAESHDMDETFERILVDYDGKQSVFTMGKLGILWELDRKSGKFIRANDLGYQNLIDVDPKTGEVTYRPGMLSKVNEELFFCPATSGFKSLRAMSYNPQTQAFYIPVHLTCETAKFIASGGVRDRTNHFHPDSPDKLGEIVALDVRTGKRLWSKRLRAPYNTSALTTNGGLLFIGDWDRNVLAYDVSGGRELWRSRLPTIANGGPITYTAGGRQYVAFAAGPSPGGTSWSTIIPPQLLKEIKHPRTGVGNGIYVFALP